METGLRMTEEEFREAQERTRKAIQAGKVRPGLHGKTARPEKDQKPKKEETMRKPIEEMKILTGKLCGVDPGGHGALAFMGEDGWPTIVVDMPVIHLTKTRTEIDAKVLYQLLAKSRPRALYVEQMQCMSKGCIANFNLGGYREAFRMVSIALGLRLIEVAPKDWQKEFRIKRTKESDTKGQSYAIACRMFPDIELVSPRGKELDGRADALLIGTFGLRQENGRTKEMRAANG